jgi:hypothetical protein
MTVATLATLFFVVVTLLGWWLVRHHFGRPAAVEAISFPDRPAAPASEPSRIILNLPSSHPHFQFTCEVEFRYAEAVEPPRGFRPREGSIEWTLYQAVKDLSAKFPLTRKDQLKYELTGALRTPIKLHNGRFVVWGECIEVAVDPEQMTTVYEGYKEDIENERLRRRIEFLDKVFENSRLATFWWLAQHTDQIDELPAKADLLYRLDKRLNPSNHADGSQIGRDLDWFLADADGTARSAMGATLVGFYSRHNQRELAEQARRLIGDDISVPVDDEVQQESSPA